MTTLETDNYKSAFPPETYSKAKEREAIGELHKLFYSVRQTRPLLTRITAYAAAAKLRSVLPSIYWLSAPKDIQSIFQTDHYRDTGLILEVSNPKRFGHKQSVLKLEANGISLRFIRSNPYGDRQYHIDYKMKAESPLRINRGSVHHAEFIAGKIIEFNKDQNLAVLLLATSATFAHTAWQTKGFTIDKPLTAYEKPPSLGFG